MNPTDRAKAATVTPVRTLICRQCLCPFTAEDWDIRHSDADGEDVHEECCDICHGDEPEHRTFGGNVTEKRSTPHGVRYVTFHADCPDCHAMSVRAENEKLRAALTEIAYDREAMQTLWHAQITAHQALSTGG